MDTVILSTEEIKSATNKSKIKNWFRQLHRILKENIHDVDFNNVDLARHLGISERQLFRTLKYLAGTPPQKYIRKFRLHYAMQLLRNGDLQTVNEAAFAIGYKNVSYFITQFEREFGKKPLKVLQESGWR